MARIFFALALLTVLLVAGNLALGHALFGYGATTREYRDVLKRLDQRRRGTLESPAVAPDLVAERDAIQARFDPLHKRMTLHFWIGIGATLATILVNSVSITYFMGTNRWCQEVVEMYRLEIALSETSRSIKRRSFPWALAGILMAIAIASLGAAADPAGYLRASAARWALPHYLIALLGTGLIGWSFLIQVEYIRANFAVIQEILTAVQSVRASRGLDMEPGGAGQGSATNQARETGP